MKYINKLNEMETQKLSAAPAGNFIAVRDASCKIFSVISLVWLAIFLKISKSSVLLTFPEIISNLVFFVGGGINLQES